MAESQIPFQKTLSEHQRADLSVISHRVRIETMVPAEILLKLKNATGDVIAV